MNAMNRSTSIVTYQDLTAVVKAISAALSDMHWSARLLVAFILLSTTLTAQDSISANRVDDRYFPLNRVPSASMPYVIAVGDRLQKPGKERITATGMLVYDPDGAAQSVPVRITWQLPLKVRLDRGGSALIYDEKNVAQALPSTSRDTDTIETLLQDTLEGFLNIQASAGSSRFLGSGFRGEESKGSPQFFDVMQVTYPAKFRGGSETSKMYYFDTRTKLLARVGYESRTGLVEVLLSDWRAMQGEMIPFSIERRENKRVSMRLTLSSGQTAPGLDDAPFTGK